jgi:hypothetical protein
MKNSEYKFSKEELFEEHSLLDVYRISRLTPANGLNVAVSLTVFFVCCTYCVVVGQDQTNVLAILRQVTSDAIAFAASVLGFLIAGFTIFVTTRPEVFLIMARIPHKAGVSYLKYNISVFMLVFIHYLCFTIVCMVLRVFFVTNGPAELFLHSLPVTEEAARAAKNYGIAIIFTLFVTWLFYILMLLKSFIFNVYHVLMTGIALTIDDEIVDEFQEGAANGD